MTSSKAILWNTPADSMTACTPVPMNWSQLCPKSLQRPLWTGEHECKEPNTVLVSEPRRGVLASFNKLHPQHPNAEHAKLKDSQRSGTVAGHARSVLD